MMLLLKQVKNYKISCFDKSYTIRFLSLSLAIMLSTILNYESRNFDSHSSLISWIISFYSMGCIDRKTKWYLDILYSGLLMIVTSFCVKQILHLFLGKDF